MRHDKLLMDHVALHKQLWTKTTLEQFGLIPGTSYSSFLKNSDIFTFGAARLGQLTPFLSRAVRVLHCDMAPTAGIIAFNHQSQP